MAHSPGILRLIVAVTLLGATGTVVEAQAWPYKTPPSPAVMDPGTVRQMRREKNTVVQKYARNGGTPGQDEKNTVKNYYVKHVLYGMTQPDALDDPLRFPNWRRELTYDLDRLGNGSSLRQYIRDDLAFKYLQSRAVGKYHPACQYNATLMLGTLNDREAERGGASTVYATPHAEARKFLIKIVRHKTLAESIKIAALVGLKRHANLLAATNNTDSAMLGPLVAVVKAQKPRPGETNDGFYWQKRLAIEALAAAGPAAAAKFIDPVVKDENLPMSVRCAAAEAMGQLDYRRAKDLDSTAFIKSLGQVAVTACRNGIQRVRDHDAQNPSNENTGNFFGTNNNEQATPEADPVVDQTRRRLWRQLECVKKGLEGVEKIAGANTTASSALRTEIEAIEKELRASPTSTAKELMEKIGPPAVQLEKAVNNV